MNLVCRSRFLISSCKRLESGDAVKKSLPPATPSPATAHSNWTHASPWPFRNKPSVSIKLTSDPGPEPIRAGRIAGRFSARVFAAKRRKPAIGGKIFLKGRMKQNRFDEGSRTPSQESPVGSNVWWADREACKGERLKENCTAWREQKTDKPNNNPRA